MDPQSLKEKTIAIFNQTQPLAKTLEGLTASELDDIVSCLEEIGYKLIKSQLQKTFYYRVPGVKSTGYIAKDHPERQLVVDHIRKLMAVPADHPHKAAATSMARALYMRHLDDRAKDAQAHTLDYTAMSQVKQVKPAATIHYANNEPKLILHKPPSKPQPQ